jgi:hypothetical protein
MRKGNGKWRLMITISETLGYPIASSGLWLTLLIFLNMKKLFLLLLVLSSAAYGQKMSKADKKTLSNLKKHISYLASDELEGRRTGSEGERKAANYIAEEFRKIGLTAAGDNGSYLQAFEVNDGKQVGPNTFLQINGKNLVQGKDYFPLVFSANGKAASELYMALKEAGEIWTLDIADEIEHQSGNPHWDIENYITEQVNKYALMGATGLIIYNSGKTPDGLVFESGSHQKPMGIPLIYLSKEAKDLYLANESDKNSISLNVEILEKKRTGNNIIGRIDNGAVQTIILGAHYDHLGRGQDHNSRYLNDTLTIHNGADDNASGVAALIELARMLKAGKNKAFNFQFISFSGEELGLYGSKAFTQNPNLDLATVNYMINMDMVGRFNDSSKALTVGGYGTSPAWATLLNRKDGMFNIHIDSSGTGPSDHTSFYLKDIPVLFFFTGTHSDYHRPEDDADKINYPAELKIVNYIFSLVETSLSQPKIAFTKTKEASTGGSRSFKVTLGIMPDYTFSGNGIHVDGVSSGRPAEKAGIKTGDVLIQLGDYPFDDIEAYMSVLGKFKKGDTTKLKFIRDGITKETTVTF